MAYGPDFRFHIDFLVKEREEELESFPVMVAAVVLWGWLEKRAGVLRGCLLLKVSIFFLFFFSSCVYHVF